jgi:DNA-binding LacI/PurR family transcriptional regulator
MPDTLANGARFAVVQVDDLDAVRRRLVFLLAGGHRRPVLIDRAADSAELRERIADALERQYAETKLPRSWTPDGPRPTP